MQIVKMTKKRILETASPPLVLEFKPRFSERTEEFL